MASYTYSSISYDYRTAIKKADNLESVAGKISSFLRGTYETNINAVRSNWSEGNAGLFIEKCVCIQSDLESIASRLSQLAEEIERCAKSIYDSKYDVLEEEERKRLAEKCMSKTKIEK